MSVAELLPLMRESGEWTCETSNPENSIRTQINVDISKKGEESRFCRPERGRFALRESAGGGGAAEGKPPQPVAQPPRRDDLGFFYILANDAFDGKWCKVLTSYKPIDPNGEEVDDPALPVAYRVISAYKTRRFSEVRAVFFAKLGNIEGKCAVEPHEGFFKVKPLSAHYLLVSVAEDFGEADGIYEAYKVEREFEPRKPHPPPADGSTEVYVGNLSYEMSEDELKAVFAKFGTVVSVRVVTNKFTGRSKGFGFVGMRDRVEAEKACSSLNGREVGGRRIKANIAKNVAPKDDDGVNALYEDLGRAFGI